MLLGFLSLSQDAFVSPVYYSADHLGTDVYHQFPRCSLVLGASVEVCQFTCADFLVGGVRCVPSCIAHLGGIHALLSPELPLCSPETAHTFKKRYQIYGKPSTLQHREGLHHSCEVLTYLKSLINWSFQSSLHLLCHTSLITSDSLANWRFFCGIRESRNCLFCAI